MENVFTAAGTLIARNTLVLDLGVDIELSKTAMLGVSYSGQIAANAADHDVKLDFSVAY